MNCCNEDELILSALGHDDDRRQVHLAACASCRAAVEEWQRLITQAADAHRVFDERHALGRERLMEALAAESASTFAPIRHTAVSRFRFPFWKGRFSMKRGLAFSGIAAATLLLAVWLVVAGRPISAMAQVAAKIRNAKSFRCEVSEELEGKQEPGGRYFWRAPGSVRMESALPQGRTQVTIYPHHQPGIEIDEKDKSYQKVPARDGYVSPVMAVWKLADFAGDADKELPARTIADKAARGFQIAAKKIDSGLDGTLEIWVDAATDLPLVVEYRMEQQKAKMTMHHFQWNVEFDAKLFDTHPPGGYADKTPQPPALEETVGFIREGLTYYSEVMGGHYPRVKMVYGDVTMNELYRKLGVDPRDLTAERIRSDAYVKQLRAIRGFGWINSILRDNADAAYYGKSIGPDDKDQVLLRWKLDNGDYCVLYGDLRSENLSPERLKALEAQ